MMREK